VSAALSAQALERPAGARGAAPAFVPGANCTSVNRAERAAVLVDTEAYYRAFAQAALRAERSIVIVGWDFHSRTPLTYGELPDGAPTRLGEFLNFLVRRRRKLHVYILVWDFPMVFSQDRELPVLYRFGWRPHRRVHIRFDDTVPVIGSHHQKLVVIDDRLAFCGGIDLTQRRLDTRRHDADDPRRTAEGESYPPFHDLMLMVDGPAARSLGRLVGDRWRRSGGSRLKPSQARGDPWPRDLAPGFTHVEVAISRTMPPRGDAAAVRNFGSYSKLRLSGSMTAMGRVLSAPTPPST
jgi:phosphatidylserine/phosphatidylglycerophosphate/cardiolipin synthase-like enzyme